MAGRQIEQDDRSSGQVSEVLDRSPGLGDAAMLDKTPDEGFRQLRGPAPDDRPADLVGQRGEQQSVAAGGSACEGRPSNGQPSPRARRGLLPAEDGPPEDGRGQQAEHAVPDKPERRAWLRQRGEQAVHQAEITARPVSPGRRADRLAPGERVPAGAEAFRGRADFPVDEDRVLPVERVRRLHCRVCPLDVQVEFPEGHRRPRERQHRRAHARD